MRTRLLLASLALLGAILASHPAGAIVNGVPDGDAHPNVGALVVDRPDLGGKRLNCSGTLIAEDVFLTAGHCLRRPIANGDPHVWVTFDATTEEVEGIVDESTTLIRASYVRHPDYGFSGPGGTSDPHDLAVILLDEPAASAYPGIRPASLPTLGQFHAMKRAGRLRGQRFTAVGYGAHDREVGGGQPSVPFSGDRWRAVSEYRALENAWLRLSQNDATADGGTCFGDSGGPNFLGAYGVDETDVIAAITVTGDSVCEATNVVYRLDTRSAREFLQRFVPVP